MNFAYIFKHKKIMALTSGCLLVLSLPPYYFWPISLVCFSYLLYCLNSSNTKKESFLLGYWFGFGFFSIGLSWIGNAVLVDPWQTGWLYPIILCASGLFFGFFVAIPSLLSFWYKNIFTKIIIFASWWTVFEWIRSFFLTGFSWNLLGTSLAFSPTMIQSASIFGTYGLTFFFIIFSGLPIAYIKDKKNRIIALSLIFVIAISNFIFGYIRLNQSYQNTPVIIRLVQPAISQKLKWEESSLHNNFIQHINMSKKQPLDNIDFVIWGETASPYNPKFRTEYLQDYISAVPDNGYLIFGGIDYAFENSKYYPKNSMFVMNKQGHVVDSYDKMHLVPFGEYVPFRKYLPEFIRPIANIIGEFKTGKNHKKIILPKKPSFGGLICYEIIFPSQIIDKNNRPQWLIVLTNDGWYGNSMGPYQHLVAAQMRAVEEGLPVVRSANTGISAVIDAYGRVIKQIPLQKSDILDVKLPKDIKATLYADYGNTIILTICLLIIAIISILHIKNKKISLK